jgi:uncharacterized protein (TIGR00106 family)
MRAREAVATVDSAVWPSASRHFRWAGPGRHRLAAAVARSLPPMATADLTVIAVGCPDASAGAYVAEIQRRLAAQQRVRYRMHAMGTSLEGTTADILAIVGELHAVPFEQGVPRVYTVLKLDERRDRPKQTLEDKVRSVEERLAAES